MESTREVRCISSAPMGLYLITRQRAFFLRLDDIQGLRLDLSLKVRYNKLTENPEFVGGYVCLKK